MAKTCSKCNFENAETNQFCKSCGSELVPPAKQKKPKIKQAQDPAIRKIITLILVAATLLCLFTCILYVIGLQPLLIVNKPRETTNISFNNTWKLWGDFFKNVINFDFTNSNTVYLVCRILCHISGSFFYMVLSALLGFNAYLVYVKSDKVKLFSIISGVAGLCVIIIGFCLDIW